MCNFILPFDNAYVIEKIFSCQTVFFDIFDEVAQAAQKNGSILIAFCSDLDSKLQNETESDQNAAILSVCVHLSASNIRVKNAKCIRHTSTLYCI